MELWELFHQCAYEVKYETAGIDVNYAFVEEGSILTIYFQGSSSIPDWVRNFWFKKKPYKDMNIPYKVHAGFLSAWKTIEDIVIEKIKDPKWKYITVVGYSHGGAIAQFCHECVWYYRPDLRDCGLMTFAFEAPRIFGSWFVPKKLKERWKDCIITRCNNDLVTHLPPWIFGYTHVGEVFTFKGDISLVKNNQPNCIKSHYPEVVEDGLKRI